MKELHKERPRGLRAQGAVFRCLLALVLAVGLMPSFASTAAEAAEVGASGDAGTVFSVDVNGDGAVVLYFTVTGETAVDGNPAVSLGRGNASGGANLAIDDTAYAGAVDVPEKVTYGGVTYTVTAVQAYAFSSGNTGSATTSALTSISFPASIVTVGDYAFCRCMSLASATYAQDSQLATLGDYSFYYCRALTAAELPASLTAVGNYAYGWDTSLATATFGGDESCLTTLGKHAFYCYSSSPGSLTEITLPAGVTAIPDYAFSNQASMESVTIQAETISSIGSHAFDGCDALTSFTFPAFDGTESNPLGTYCLANCDSLSTLVFMGDIASYDFNVNNGKWYFYQDTIDTIVFHGSALAFSSEGGQGSSDTFSDTVCYYNVTFYASQEDAAAGTDAMGSARVRDDVTYAQFNDRSFTEDQIYDDGGAVPVATGAWAVSGLTLSTDTLTDSTYAYDTADGDLAGCTITLAGGTTYYRAGQTISLDYTVTTASGTLLVEGEHYTATVYAYDDDGDVTGEALSPASLTDAGSYVLRVEGVDPYSGTVEIDIEIEEFELDWDVYTGSYAHTEAFSSLYESAIPDYDADADVVFLVGTSDRELSLAALGGLSAGGMIAVTEASALSSQAYAIIHKTAASDVVILGDTTAVDSAVDTSVSAMSTGPSVSRLTSESAAACAVSLYNVLKGDGVGASGVAYVVASDNCQIAAAINSLAYADGAPIFFCSADGALDADTLAALGDFSSIVVAGEDAASAMASIQTQVDDASVSFSAIEGTASSISQELAASALAALGDDEEMNIVVAPATSEGALDAALAAQYAAFCGGILILVDDVDDAQGVVDDLLTDYIVDVDTLRFMGTSAHLSDDVINCVLALWSETETYETYENTYEVVEEPDASSGGESGDDGDGDDDGDDTGTGGETGSGTADDDGDESGGSTGDTTGSSDDGDDDTTDTTDDAGSSTNTSTNANTNGVSVSDALAAATSALSSGTTATTTTTTTALTAATTGSSGLTAATATSGLSSVASSTLAASASGTESDADDSSTDESSDDASADAEDADGDEADTGLSDAENEGADDGAQEGEGADAEAGVNWPLVAGIVVAVLAVGGVATGLLLRRRRIGAADADGSAPDSAAGDAAAAAAARDASASLTMQSQSAETVEQQVKRKGGIS